jgi:pimeloyl-ACP methyl ester carboxylesterase
MRKDITVILAHGAWADGSSWTRVAGPLMAEGYRVVAAPLPLTTFDADVAAVERAIDRTSGPVILASHAYAGAVIGAVRGDRVKALIYISALAPDEGETVAEVFSRASPHARAPALAPDNAGLIYLPESAFGAAFAPNASAADQALLAAVQRPISVACITVKMSRPRWHDLPAWYLIAEQDVMILEETQRFMATRMKARIQTHPVDHVPLVSAPDVVIDLIRKAAAAVRT